MGPTPFNVQLVAGKLAKLARIEKLVCDHAPLDGSDLELMLVKTRSQVALILCAKALLEVRRDPGHSKGCICPTCEDADKALMELGANDE